MYNVTQAAATSKIALTEIVDKEEMLEFNACCVGHAIYFGMHLRTHGVSFQRIGIHFVVTKDSEPEYEIRTMRVLKPGVVEVIFDEDVALHSDIDTLRDNMDSLEYRVARSCFGGEDKIPVSACAQWLSAKILWIVWSV